MNAQLIIIRAQKLGSKSGTVKGAAKFLCRPDVRAEERKRIELREESRRNSAVEEWRIGKLLDRAAVGTSVLMTNARPQGYSCSPLVDLCASNRSYDALVQQNPRKKNVSQGGPKIFGDAHQKEWDTIRYKGKFKGWTGSSATSRYQSAICITRSGRSAVIVTECKIVRRIMAPAGMTWRMDNEGAFLRRVSDGIDYHPTPDDLRAKAFVRRVRRQMAANTIARRKAKSVEREQKRTAAIFNREVKSTRVTLDDSRRAGNCIEGSLAFAERRLGMDRTDIIDGRWLVSVPAAKLIATGDSRAIAAVRAAFARETTVAI